MWKLIDKVFDDISAKLAENLTENIDAVDQNRAARELSEFSDPELRKIGLSRQKLQQGKDAYPWRASYSKTTEQELAEDLKQLVAQMSRKSPPQGSATSSFIA
ncbi:MAG: hypothetical protein ACRBCI_15370 [Cellvibrionaceae bacterium]